MSDLLYIAFFCFKNYKIPKQFKSFYCSNLYFSAYYFLQYTLNETVGQNLDFLKYYSMVNFIKFFLIFHSYINIKSN